MSCVKLFYKQSIVQKLSINLFMIKTRSISAKSDQIIESCKVLVVGGGTGGCSVGAKLSVELDNKDVIILEPSDVHYYQPMFTMIGGGLKKLSHSFKLMKDVLPSKAKIISEKATNFDPSTNTVTTNTSRRIKYDVLLIAMGMQLNYNKIPGLLDALAIPGGNVTSIYAPEYVNRHYEALQKFKSGNVLFTYPTGCVKCPGAGQKIMYLSEHYLTEHNKRQNTNIIYNTSLPVLYGVKHYADALWPIIENKQIQVNLGRNLIEVLPQQNVAVFESTNNQSDISSSEYSLLHVVPPMSAPNELLQCRELINADGYLNVDKYTLQHNKYQNIFAIGDCAGTPNSKTAASAAAQAPVVCHHILATLKGKDLTQSYTGYSSCPILTGYDKCMLAEFDYSLTPLETFPFAQDQERYSMFVLTKDILPMVYWKLMLKGLWNGPETFRKLFTKFKSAEHKKIEI